MNFSPRVLSNNILSTELDLKKLHCRNFIFTVLSLELLTKKTSKTNTNLFNINFFFFKERKHFGSTLRATYKSKTAQFSLGLYRYFMIFNFNLKIKTYLNIKNKNDFLHNYLKLLKNYNYFESALVTQVYRSICLPTNVIIF